MWFESYDNKFIQGFHQVTDAKIFLMRLFIFFLFLFLNDKSNKENYIFLET